MIECACIFISELVDCPVYLWLRFIKNYVDRHVFTVALVKKFIYVALLNLNLFFLKTVTRVSVCVLTDG